MPVEIGFFGDQIIELELPDSTEVLSAPEPLPAQLDPIAAIRQALAQPIGTLPLDRLVHRGSRVVIAFGDLALPVPPMEEPDVRGLTLSVVLDILRQSGVADDDITLICANGLHRKCRPPELATILGKGAVDSFGAGRLLCHDGEAASELSLVGHTRSGDPVEINRLVSTADLAIFLNVSWTTMNGGWKSFMVGLGSRRCIARHHAPAVLNNSSKMDPGRSALHRMIDEMGETAAAALGRQRFFSIEAVLNNQLPYQLAAVFAGYTPEVHRRTLTTLMRQQSIVVEGQADILVYCLPSLSPYAVNSTMNPVLVYNLALGYVFALYHGRPLVREGGIVIIGQPCEYQFDDQHHPSYRTFFDRVLSETRDPFEIHSRFEEEFLRNSDYMDAYQHGFGFHPLHPFYVWYWAGIAANHASRIYLAGVEEPWVAQRMGLEPAPSIESAIDSARRHLGKDARIRYLRIPPLFSAVVS